MFVITFTRRPFITEDLENYIRNPLFNLIKMVLVERWFTTISLLKLLAKHMNNS